MIHNRYFLEIHGVKARYTTGCDAGYATRPEVIYAAYQHQQPANGEAIVITIRIGHIEYSDSGAPIFVED